MPVMVVNRDDDIVVPTVNSIVMYQRIREASRSCHFHIYPDVGYGFLNEYPVLFAAHVLKHGSCGIIDSYSYLQIHSYKYNLILLGLSNLLSFDR